MSNAETVSKLEDWRFDPEALQLEIILSAPSQPRYFFLSQPSRIVVDLPSTKLGYVSTQQNFSGAIKSIRVSQLNADVTRIVMDLMPGTFINPNQVQLQPVSPENPTRWVLSPVTVSNNAYSIPTNIFPSYQQTPNSGLYNPPPPSQNQPFPTTTYYNQQPLVTVPPCFLITILNRQILLFLQLFFLTNLVISTVFLFSLHQTYQITHSQTPLIIKSPIPIQEQLSLENLYPITLDKVCYLSFNELTT